MSTNLTIRKQTSTTLVEKEPMTHIAPKLSDMQLLLPIEIISIIYGFAFQIDKSNILDIMKVDKHALNEMRRLNLCTLNLGQTNTRYGRNKICWMNTFAEWSKENGLLYDFNKFIKNISVEFALGYDIKLLTLFTHHSPLHLERIRFKNKEKMASKKFIASIATVRHLYMRSQYIDYLSESALDSVLEITCEHPNDAENMFVYLNKCKNIKSLSLFQYRDIHHKSVKLNAKLESLYLKFSNRIESKDKEWFGQISHSSDSLTQLKLVQSGEGYGESYCFNFDEVLTFLNLKVLCIFKTWIDMSNLLPTITQLHQLSRLEMTKITIKSITQQDVEDLFSIASTGKPLVDITLMIQIPKDAVDTRLQISHNIANGRDLALVKYTKEQLLTLKFVINKGFKSGYA